MALCTPEYHRDNRSERRDARGIFLTYVCDKCESDKMARYRADVLTDSDYWADEPIEDD